MTIVRVSVTVAVKKAWDIFQLDVNNAFLHGDLYEEVYMEVPPGLLIDQIGPQRIWGKLYYFLGLEVLYKSDGVIISQRKFTLDLLKEYDCSVYKSLSSPLDPAVKLKADEGTLLPDPTYYRKLVGKLNFLTNTRLDIAYSVQLLSQFIQAPRDTHLTAAFHLLMYLKTDPTLGIFFSKNDDCSIAAYCDSDWASCPDSRKSVPGYIVLVGDSPISWKSKKQETISLASPEAEYKSLRKVVGELGKQLFGTHRGAKDNSDYLSAPQHIDNDLGHHGENENIAPGNIVPPAGLDGIPDVYAIDVSSHVAINGNLVVNPESNIRGDA
ncbi:uncharacterized mitochondrial protein AtMg00810-like [Nicotiana sylvestris]|uniref:uncharacterized mitochondrial protein AtMg00810-like n=1 Tax=Nicotiana sylvestris TaxID=4096 RepID=UPI00388C7831